MKYKKACYKIWKKTGQIEDKKEYARAKMNSKRVVRKAKQRKSKETAKELDSNEGRKSVFRIAKQIVKDRQDVVKANCLKYKQGNLVLDE